MKLLLILSKDDIMKKIFILSYIVLKYSGTILLGQQIHVEQATDDGILIEKPGADGIQIDSAQVFAIRITNPKIHGISVANAGTDGIFLSFPKDDGVHILNAGDNGLEILGPASHGARISNAGGDGVHISDAQESGVRIDGAEESGVRIDDAGDDGLYVKNTGSNGIRISGSALDAIRIDNSMNDGIQILGTQYDGIRISGAGNKAGHFKNDATSNEPAVHIEHGDDLETDLFLGGHAQISTNGSYVLQLDEDDNFEAEQFSIKRSASQGGGDVFHVSETGEVTIAGNISKGGGSFKIDHPLDPENKYLFHSFVESPDMLNVYNGNAILNEDGEAKIEMPDYFTALNRDFRYQLTPIGSFAELYVAKEIEENSFKIAGGRPGGKVSWQVTGIRRDPFAMANRIPNELLKEAHNRGKYLHASEWAKSKGVSKLPSIGSGPIGNIPDLGSIE